MAHIYREVRQTTVPNDTVGRHGSDYAMNVVARVVSIIGGIIMLLVALRFLFALLGANASNGFANFIYSVSRPFVSPFFGLFNYHETIGTGRFEVASLAALVFWGFVTWLVERLLTIGSVADREV